MLADNACNSSCSGIHLSVLGSRAGQLLSCDYPIDIWSVEKLETLPAGTKSRTSHHRSLEMKGMERGSARRSSLKGQERAIVNQTNIEIISQVSWGKFWESGWAHMGFSERIDTILNWTELFCAWRHCKCLEQGHTIPLAGCLISRCLAVTEPVFVDVNSLRVNKRKVVISVLADVTREINTA